MVVFGGVTVGRVIATADMTACQAHPQVDPGASDLEAVFATFGAWGDVLNLVEVSAAHESSLVVFESVEFLTGRGAY